MCSTRDNQVFWGAPINQGQSSVVSALFSQGQPSVSVVGALFKQGHPRVVSALFQQGAAEIFWGAPIYQGQSPRKQGATNARRVGKCINQVQIKPQMPVKTTLQLQGNKV